MCSVFAAWTSLPACPPRLSMTNWDVSPDSTRTFAYWTSFTRRLPRHATLVRLRSNAHGGGGAESGKGPLRPLQSHETELHFESAPAGRPHDGRSGPAKPVGGTTDARLSGES